jgi:Zn-dependent M28 family amino/carboxypeptidase
MIGRKDSLHTNDQYVYLIGADRISKDLHNISEQVNKKTINFALDYTYNRPSDPNMFYYRSDHYNFAKHGIPVIFYFSGVHEDYHKPTDDVEKILFPKLEKITQLIYYTAWELVNRNERIRING